MTKPEHIVNWFAAFDDTMTVCEVDLRVGGAYHYVAVTPDGRECSFRGTFLEITAPTRIVDTWLFEDWPEAEAVETVTLQDVNGVTKLTNSLAFRDQAGRDHMTKTDGFEDSFNKMDGYITSLLDPTDGSHVCLGWTAQAKCRERESNPPMLPQNDRKQRRPELGGAARKHHLTP